MSTYGEIISLSPPFSKEREMIFKFLLTKSQNYQVLY